MAAAVLADALRKTYPGSDGPALDGAPPDLDPDQRRVTAPVRERMSALAATVAALGAEGVDAEDLTVRRPTLDEVFLQVTEVSPR